MAVTFRQLLSLDEYTGTYQTGMSHLHTGLGRHLTSLTVPIMLYLYHTHTVPKLHSIIDMYLSIVLETSFYQCLSMY